MKKRRLKKWVRITLCYIVGLTIVMLISKFSPLYY